MGRVTPLSTKVAPPATSSWVNVISAPRMNDGFDGDSESATVPSACASAPAPALASPAELPPESKLDPELAPEPEPELVPEAEPERVPEAEPDRDVEPDPKLVLASSPGPRSPRVDDDPQEAATHAAIPSAMASEERWSIRINGDARRTKRVIFRRQGGPGRAVFPAAIERRCALMPKPPPRQTTVLQFGALETFIGFFLRLAQVTVYEDFFRGAPVRMTPSQFAALILVEHNPEAMQQDLCEGLALDKSTFSTMVDGLSEQKLIRSLRSKEDRRRNALRLTPKGRAALKVMLAHVVRHERRVFARLSRIERMELTILLKRVGDPGSIR
jgi:DNA-binding MarR family transcriptional regulator